MLVLKGCERCRGDMFEERNTGLSELLCLQCGHRRLFSVPQPSAPLGLASLARARKVLR